MSIVEKMADAVVAAQQINEECTFGDMLRAAFAATGLTEEQIEGIASGELVILPNPLKARERADAVADRAMLAAKEGSE